MFTWHVWGLGFYPQHTPKTYIYIKSIWGWIILATDICHVPTMSQSLFINNLGFSFCKWGKWGTEGKKMHLVHQTYQTPQPSPAHLDISLSLGKIKLFCNKVWRISWNWLNIKKTRMGVGGVRLAVSPALLPTLSKPWWYLLLCRFAMKVKWHCDYHPPDLILQWWRTF